MSQQQDVDETVKALQQHRGVKGIIVMNYDGIPIRSTFTDAKLGVHYAALVTFLVQKTQSFLKRMDGSPLDSIRLRSQKNELIIAPGKDFIMVVVHQPDAQFGATAIPDIVASH
eukprot:EC725144.1.p1 GENE.EC725144.1~~EC725144.1.p1  ORF type:complete len:114 (+),score=20.79 EC725144.1:62-403(+)